MIVFDGRREDGEGQSIRCEIVDGKLWVQDYYSAAKGNPYWKDDESGTNYWVDEAATAVLAQQLETTVEGIPQAIVDAIAETAEGDKIPHAEAASYFLTMIRNIPRVTVKDASPSAFFGSD